MFVYVYVLESLKTNELYIGYTTDLKRRIYEHNRNLNFSTKFEGPWQLVYFEAFLNKEDVLSTRKVS